MVAKRNEDCTPLAIDTQKRKDFFGAVKNLYDQMAKSQSQTDQSELLRDDYRKLVEFLKPLCHEDRTVVVLALDKTQSLTKWRVDSEYYTFSPAHILWRVIRDYSFVKYQHDADVWVLFSSTNSKVTHFSAPPTNHPSQRVFNNELLFPPFSALHWDIFAPSPEELNVLSVGLYEDAIRFGRPLWQSVASLHSDPLLMSSYAVTKLTCQEITVSVADTPPQALLAVLSQRFALGVMFGSHEAVPFISNSVASYMRILVSTTEDRIWQETIYPSEPVLSHAAAEFMHRDETSLGLHLHCLVGKILSGLIKVGEFGELIGRLLILISRDFAAILAYKIVSGSLTDSKLPSVRPSAPFPLPATEFFRYLRPVPLLDVLSILFGSDRLFDLDDKALAQRIKSTFARAYVSFSHWVVFDENIGPLPNDITSEYWLKALFLRGAAVQSCRNQPLIDGVIPILYLDDNDQYAGMSSWLIQYKNRSEFASGALIENKDIALDTKLPYVVTCFDFGLGVKKEHETRAQATFPELSRNCDRTNADTRTRALRIEVAGLSDKVFPVLKVRESVARDFLALGEATRKLKMQDAESVNQKSFRIFSSSARMILKRKIEDIS